MLDKARKRGLEFYQSRPKGEWDKDVYRDVCTRVLMVFH